MGRAMRNEGMGNAFCVQSISLSKRIFGVTQPVHRYLQE